MANFFAELKRRHIYRVAAAYAVVAWVLLQLVNNVRRSWYRLPGRARASCCCCVVGFPVALLFAWVFSSGTPETDGGRRSGADQARHGGLDADRRAGRGDRAGVVSAVCPLPARERRNSRRASPAPLPAAISIAVLPFANLSGDAGQEFFSDGMTEEINGALAKVPDLRVVGRTSAFQFKGQKKDLRAIGQV